MSRIGILWVSLALVIPAWSQKRVDGVHSVDPSAMYHHVYAVVPLIGAGTKADPKRPMFAPSPTAVASQPGSSTGGTGSTAGKPTQTHTGILAYQMQVSDNGKFALVEFVLASPKDVPTAIDATVPGVLVFERGKSTEAQIEATFQQYKKGFQISMFGMRAQ